MKADTTLNNQTNSKEKNKVDPDLNLYCKAIKIRQYATSKMQTIRKE